MSPNLEVVVGTYEQFLVGYTIDNVVNEYKIAQSFATHNHLASIRSVDSKNHYLASSAADDSICLFDMRTRTESGKLIHHNDTVNSIAFTPDASHLITTSSDGTIGIVRCGNWQLEKHWLKPHQGLAVDTLAIHPTGKMAMTTGHDGVLRTWNLVKGRQAYATNLVPRWKLDAKNISVLKWSPNGQSYVLAANNKVDVYSIETAGIKEELTFDTKVACVEYLDEEYIAVGLTDGNISIHNLESASITKVIKAHDGRVKCMAKDGDLLISASSSGEIKVWSIKKDDLTFLNKVNCNARISCITLTSYNKLITKKEDNVAKEIREETASNKLQMKKVVVIEEEDESDNGQLVMTKKNKKGNKIARKDENDDIQEIKVLKKSKRLKESSKRASDEITSTNSENKKKKLELLVNKKRKSASDEILSVKPKKLKNNSSLKATDNNENTIDSKKKKRKNVNGTKVPQKKFKSATSTEKSTKTKKKKTFKNKISR